MNRFSGLQSPSPIEPRRGSVASSISNTYSGLTNSDQPTFSPFPPLRNRSANVPPSDEEKEAVLEKARLPVLSANDPEVQLSWAQDTLAFVEIAAQYEARISPNLSSRPQTPSTEHQLRVDAVNIVSFLADQSHPKAEFLKGMWLEFGKFGLRMDKKEAFRCYQRAAQRGFARAEYRMGMQFENSNEPDKALKHYQLGVDAGDSASNYRIGMMTLLGQHNQPLDYAKGIKMISYAAETADENAPQGAYVFGMLQSRELTQVSVPEQFLALNISGARYNIEKAAYLGFAKAQAKMGVAYELCQLGCDFNPALSLHYDALASRQGEAEADMSISKWFLCGYEGVFDKNEELAFTYAQRAAQSGLANAEFAMGYFYEVGIYVRADLKASRSWYEKAADNGNKDAASRIDGISRSKTLSRKDHEQTAVAKIQSQYGSHRGKRPDRFKQPETMPTISDDTVDMPEPRLPPPRQQQGPPYPGAYGSQGFGVRPSSAAPYPVDEGRSRPPPQVRPSTGPTYQNYAPPRRGSNMPPLSTAEGGSSYGDSNYRGSSFPTFRPQAQAGPSPSLGRVPQVPLNNVPSSAGAQNYRRPLSGQSTPYGHGSPDLGPSRPATQPPAVDIGFSAPPDPSGADRRRLQKGTSNRPLPPGTLPRNSSYDVSQNAPPRDRLAGLPHPSTMPSQGRTNSPARGPLSTGRSSGPAIPSVNVQSRPEGSNPVPILPPKLQDPAGLGRATNTPPPNAPVARPPGKGPKTFQEMGVPPSKNESDCVSQLA